VTICSRRQLKFLKLAALRKDALKAQIAGYGACRTVPEAAVMCDSAVSFVCATEQCTGTHLVALVG
jgi:hypothetical protein